jgi:opacity protein-like surface antigen
MKHLSFALFATLCFSGLTHAENGVYTSIKAGLSDSKLQDGSSIYLYDSDDIVNTEQYELNDKTKAIYPSIAIAAGFDFSQISQVNIRTELEYNYKDTTTFETDASSYQYVFESAEHNHEFSTALPANRKLFRNRLQSQSLMLNAYYDFKNQSAFTPYVQAGAGFTHIKNQYLNIEFPDYHLTKTDQDFSWSAGVGVAYQISPAVALDLSYKYVDAGEFSFAKDIYIHRSETSSFKFTSQDYALGIRYNF